MALVPSQLSVAWRRTGTSTDTTSLDLQVAGVALRLSARPDPADGGPCFDGTERFFAVSR